ncbi:AtpZ/AtpI family protein [Chloroflexota bacterium]
MNRRMAAMRLVGVGFFIGICLLLGVLAGLWLDGKFGTKPIFMMLGLLLGLVVAGYGVYQMLLPLLRNNQDKGNS